MEDKAGEFRIYKGIGAFTMKLLPARRNDKGYIDRKGAVLIEVAPSAGEKQWDWTKKITFALGIQDVANLLDSNPKANRLFHDNDGLPKVLEFTAGEEGTKYEGTYMLSVAEGDKTSRNQVRVPFTNGEYQVFLRLIVAAAPSMIGWSF